MQPENRTITAGVCPALARLPKKGLCPYTHLSRRTLLELENEGLIQLIRIIRPGLKRGIVFIPVDEVLELFMRNGRRSGPVVDSHAGGGDL
jgi:hypothetical protein